jgi:hypothetical protein
MVKKIVLILSVFVMVFILIGCDTSAVQRDQSVKTRTEMFERAQSQVPEPIPDNFLARKMLAKYVERQDVPDHPFYIYVLAETGNIIGYYVSQAAPVNINAFLSSTEDVRTSGAIATAPSLDGIFYGGAGSSQGGDGWFFFDAASDALIILYGVKMFVADQPLKIYAKPITVDTLKK